MAGIQLRDLRLGDRVKIVLDKECIRYGGGKVYPNEGIGTVADFVKNDGNHGCYADQGSLVYVNLDKPFLRTGLVTKPVLMKRMHVPNWRVERIR